MCVYDAIHLQAAGLANKEVMTVEDFKRIFGGHLEKAEVQLHGHTTGQQRPSITPVTSAAAAAGGAAPMPASDFATSFRERLTTGLNAEKSSKSCRTLQTENWVTLAPKHFSYCRVEAN